MIIDIYFIFISSTPLPHFPFATMPFLSLRPKCENLLTLPKVTTSAKSHLLVIPHSFILPPQTRGGAFIISLNKSSHLLPTQIHLYPLFPFSNHNHLFVLKKKIFAGIRYRRDSEYQHRKNIGRYMSQTLLFPFFSLLSLFIHITQNFNLFFKIFLKKRLKFQQRCPLPRYSNIRLCICNIRVMYM